MCIELYFGYRLMRIIRGLLTPFPKAQAKWRRCISRSFACYNMQKHYGRRPPDVSIYLGDGISVHLNQ